MIGRFFMIVVLFVVSMYIVKYVRKRIDEALQDKKSDSGKSNLNNTDQKKLMLKCQLCGLHIPEKEAIKQGDNIFCSLEHAKKGL